MKVHCWGKMGNRLLLMFSVGYSIRNCLRILSYDDLFFIDMSINQVLLSVAGMRPVGSEFRKLNRYSPVGRAR